MRHAHLKTVLLSPRHALRDVYRLGGTSDVVGAEFLAVEQYVAICAHSLESQEILLAFHIGSCERFAEHRLAVQVAVFLLQRSVIVVEVEGYVFGEGLSTEGYLPAVVQTHGGAFAHWVRRRE